MPTKSSSIDLCDAVPVLSFEDERGVLSVHQTKRYRRFRRIFWLHHVPAGTSRGNHALRKTTQTLIVIQGTARLKLEDTAGNVCIMDLYDQGDAVIVPPLVWRTLDLFSEDAIIMVLCDLAFDKSEYIENRSAWKEEQGQ